MNFDPFQQNADGLKAKAVKGGIYTTINQVGKFALTLLGTMALGRLLSPDEYGVYATATVVTVLLNTFKELGLSVSTIQKADITPGQVSDLFWINLLFSFVLMAGTLAAGPLMSWFYDEPRVTGLLAVLSFTYLFSGLSVQHKALLYRGMQFKSIAKIEIMAATLSTLAGVLAAWAGASYYALGWMQLTLFGVEAVATFYFCPWVPQRGFHRTGLRENLKMGWFHSLFMFFNYFATNADNILIRKTEGSAALGLYARAYSLLMLPINQVNTPITSVAVPTLSRLQQEPERFKQFYLKALTLVSMVTMPAIALMAALSEELIWVLLGDQWTGVSDIFTILAIAAFVRPTYNTTGWVFMAMGRTKQMAQWGLFAAPLIVLSFAVGLWWNGITGLALCYTGIMLLLGWPLMHTAYRTTHIRPLDALKAISHSLGISTLLFGVLFAVKHWGVPDQVIWVKLAAYAVCCLLIGLPWLWWRLPFLKNAFGDLGKARQ